MAIKNIDIELIINRANDNIDIKVDMGILMNRIIYKTDVKLIVNRLHKANITIGKKLDDLNLFWLLLTFNKSLMPKIMFFKPLLFK